jgi:N-dimethylarginine dimethylaminohydrolase
MPERSTEWSGTFQSDVGRIRRVLLEHPRDAWVDAPSVETQWRALGYVARPDFEAACAEADALATLLERLGIEVVRLAAEPVGLDSIYVRDASVVCDRGAVLCSMGKPARRAEPARLGAAYAAAGIPVLGAIDGAGRLEGGDVVWLDPRTVAVGRGYRTDEVGIRQLAELLGDAVDTVITAPLPHWNGPDDVFHLMSVVSPLDRDLALVYSPLLPVPFREGLLARGFALVEVPDEEFESLGCNVLAVAPRVAVAVDGNPETRRRMEAAGVEVHTYRGEEISAKGCGGPTCLTRPLERASG